jgi:hypothetical protein
MADIKYEINPDGLDNQKGEKIKIVDERGFGNNVKSTRSQSFNFIETLPSSKPVEYIFSEARKLGFDYTQLQRYVSRLLIEPNENAGFRPSKRKSKLGTAIERFVQIYTQDHNPGDRLEGPLALKNDSYGKNIFLDICAINISQGKSIRKTQVIGARGTIKELVSMDDLQIEIVGQLVDNSKLFPPLDQIDNMYALYEKNETLNIYSEYLGAMGVTKVVMENLTITENQQFKNVVDYSIKLVSDHFTPMKLAYLMNPII